MRERRGHTATAPKACHTGTRQSPPLYSVNTPIDARTSAKWLILVGQVAYFFKDLSPYHHSLFVGAPALLTPNSAATGAVKCGTSLRDGGERAIVL